VKDKTAIAKQGAVALDLMRMAEEIRQLMRNTAANKIAIGVKLTAAKEGVRHGEWGAWLSANLELSERSAQRFMRMADQFKTANLADLDISPSALYLLAEPSTPEDIREAVLEQARAGAKITLAAVQKAIGPEMDGHQLEEGKGPLAWLRQAPPELYADKEWRYKTIWEAFLSGAISYVDLKAVVDEHLDSERADEQIRAAEVVQFIREKEKADRERIIELLNSVLVAIEDKASDAYKIAHTATQKILDEGGHKKSLKIFTRSFPADPEQAFDENYWCGDEDESAESCIDTAAAGSAARR
jgi:hypothetical protein